MRACHANPNPPHHSPSEIKTHTQPPTHAFLSSTIYSMPVREPPYWHSAAHSACQQPSHAAHKAYLQARSNSVCATCRQPHTATVDMLPPAASTNTPCDPGHCYLRVWHAGSAHCKACCRPRSLHSLRVRSRHCGGGGSGCAATAHVLPTSTLEMASASLSFSTGLDRNPSMPAAWHSSLSLSDALAVMARMGVATPRARIARVASTPPMTGIIMSIKMTS
mmetsp:Transcript_8081/g.20205  ORF Transcript_8081/g.20205 Transcript_8081/m.20205 type:complete len:221 (-) Transcript_8081:2477-3139(-)